MREESSIEQYNCWDETAFDLLYKNFFRALTGYALQFVGETRVAEDLVQDLFSVIWEKKMHFDSIIFLRAFLYNSIRNASLDFLKHKNVEDNYLHELADANQLYKTTDEGEDSFFSEEIYRQLFLAIDELPQRCREIFLMYMDGKKNHEIAEALQVSIETVKTHKKRAMAALREKFNPKDFVFLQLLLP
jgi:RNA polymerase sigma-70 factor (family 1)